MNYRFITTTRWIQLLDELAGDRAVFGLVPEGNHLFWKKIAPGEASEVIVSGYRSTYPLKSFLFPIKEEVTHEPRAQKAVLVGVKACDILQLKTSDAIFIGGVLVDPYYEVKRKNTLIISADCDESLPSCFCTLMGGEPFPKEGFDLNLSPVKGGYVVEPGSRTGKELVAAHAGLFDDTSDEQLAERKATREKIARQVRERNREFTWREPKELITEGYLSEKWNREIAGPCVECDACRFACGSCYCFLLSETQKPWEKIRAWDSCQSEGYARVAGGANPKKTKGERLRNFYACKLLYRHENLGFYACSGCGRCIDVCQGKIDMRKSLQKLHDEIKEKKPTVRK